MGKYSNTKNNLHLTSSLEKLNLRFPVSMVSKACDYGKGNVSNYIKGNKPASDNFIKIFNEVYNLGSSTEENTTVNEVKVKRIKLNLTQDQLGKELGVSGKTIQAYESGTQAMPESKVKLLHLYYADQTKEERSIEELITERVISSIEPMLKEMIESTVKSVCQAELDEIHDSIRRIFLRSIEMSNLMEGKEKKLGS